MRSRTSYLPAVPGIAERIAHLPGFAIDQVAAAAGDDPDVLRMENLGVRGLELGAGVYNILGTDFRLAQPYAGGHAPLPALSREFLVRLSYLFDAGTSGASN